MNGSLRQKGKGWELRYYDPASPVDPLSGRRRLKSKTFHGGKREVEAQVTIFMASIQSPGHIDSEDLTVKDILEQWMKNQVIPNYRIKTREHYKTLIKNHVPENLLNRQIKKLTVIQITEFYNHFNGTPAILSGLHRVLHAAFEWAFKKELIERNVFAKVDAPPRPKREYRTLTVEEAKRLLRAAEQTRYHAFLGLALTTGMRLNELTGLRWSDIDFQNNVINIREQVTKAGSCPEFGPVKTRDSKRSVPLLDGVSEELKLVYREQCKVRMKAKKLWEDYDLVFTSKIGRPWNGHDLSHRMFKNLLKKAKLPEKEIRFHDLRHSVATLLNQDLNVDLKTVSDILGHASIEITDRIYLHTKVDHQRPAIDKLGDALYS